jgi:hypothetical protein
MRRTVTRFATSRNFSTMYIMLVSWCLERVTLATSGGSTASSTRRHVAFGGVSGAWNQTSTGPPHTGGYLERIPTECVVPQIHEMKIAGSLPLMRWLPSLLYCTWISVCYPMLSCSRSSPLRPATAASTAYHIPDRVL